MKYHSTQRLLKYKLPFTKELKDDLDSLKLRIKNNKASLLIIDGAVGEGKTTLAVHCADYINDSPITFNQQLAMGGQDFQEKLQICHDSKLGVIIYDEAGDFDKRGSLTGFNKQLNRVFDTFRAYKILVILVLPNFNVLDNSLFDKQVPRVLLHCNKRTNNFGKFKAYSLYRMYFLREKLSRMTVKPQAYSNTAPNYHGHFYDLFPDRSKELDKFSTSNKLEILSDNVLKNRGLKTKKELAKQLNRSLEWVNKKLRIMKLKPSHKYKRTNYYDMIVFETLKEARS